MACASESTSLSLFEAHRGMALLVPLFRGLGLLHALAAEDVPNTASPLVARVLKDLILGIPLPGNHDRPGPCPRFWVLDGGVVVNSVLADGYKAFSQMKVPEGHSCSDDDPRGDATHMLLVGEIGRIDNQDVALPVTNRVSVPLADVSANMRTPVQRDETGIQPLTDNHYPPRRLHDVRSTVVPHWTVWRL